MQLQPATAPHPASGGGNMTWQHVHWFPSLPFQRFQVLFNSLLKVLCIFPSRYLYAIGFPPIFSFRWNLPPTLSCNPKQLDSLSSDSSYQAYGSLTLSAAMFQWTWPGMVTPPIYRLQLGATWYNMTQYDTVYDRCVCLRRFTSWTIPASVALTEGILVSFLSSAY